MPAKKLKAMPEPDHYAGITHWPKVAGKKNWDALFTGEPFQIDLTDHIAENGLDAAETIRAFQVAARSAAYHRGLLFETVRVSATVVAIQATVPGAKK